MLLPFLTKRLDEGGLMVESSPGEQIALIFAAGSAICPERTARD
jgi:hypothetical protein